MASLFNERESAERQQIVDEFSHQIAEHVRIKKEAQDAELGRREGVLYDDDPHEVIHGQTRYVVGPDGQAGSPEEYHIDVLRRRSLVYAEKIEVAGGWLGTLSVASMCHAPTELHRMLTFEPEKNDTFRVVSSLSLDEMHAVLDWAITGRIGKKVLAQLGQTSFEEAGRIDEEMRYDNSEERALLAASLREIQIKYAREALAKGQKPMLPPKVLEGVLAEIRLLDEQEQLEIGDTPGNGLGNLINMHNQSVFNRWNRF